MSRFTPLEHLTLTPAQQRVVDDVRAGRRGAVPANVVAWLASPELARRAAALGEFVRYETSLPARLLELAILVVARRWSCDYEWAIHAGEAARAGVAPTVVEAIGQDVRPVLPEPGESAVYDFAVALVTAGRVPDDVYGRAVAAVGDAGVTDLAGLVGYYTLVAFTLNVREVPAPSGAPRLAERA